MTDRKIITSFDYPPIPYRECDWSAWIDGTEESGPYGRGATEQAAIADLMEQLDEDDNETGNDFFDEGGQFGMGA